MNSASSSLTLTKDPLWPWSLSWGLPVLAILALGIVALTVWTYWGVPKVRAKQVITLIVLRLLALILALLMLLRPSFASPQDLKIPSLILFLLDGSESMTIQDEVDGKSRWEYMREALEKAEPILVKLREENNITIVFYSFAEDINEWDPNGTANGKRTDFGQSLHSLFDNHSRDRNLRALLLFSDGADNGNRFPPLMEAGKWRALPCPIHTFGLGKPTTADRQRDIAFTDIIPVPSPVPIKGKLTVKGILDAPGFVNAVVTVRLFIDDKEVLVQKETLRKIQGNEVKLITDAPLTRPPTGEIKVTLKVDPTPGENILTNNEISTYVTVTQEGISVLLVDQPRFPEPQRICDALAMDQRVRIYPAWLGQKALTPDEGNLLQFDKQHYDVIILGDITANRLAGGNPAILDKIDDLVKDKGTGLMMMGGFDSFGNSDWKGTAIERMLPVFLDVEGEVPGLIRVEPTPDGLRSYVMRQSEDPEKTKLLWAKLPELTGMNRLGKEKPGAKILAVRAGTNQSVLVSQDYGKGRTIAFAGDTSWRWQRLGQPKSQEGEIAHSRFWRQVVLWLAHQDETEGSVWIKPDSRRLAAGSKLGFTVGLRGKGGVDAKEATFDVTVVDPKGNESPVPTAKEASGERGTFWKSDLPGEYKLVVKGHGKDPGGNLIPEDKTAARFLVYQDDVEMVRRAADHEFLAKLANSGGGKLHKPEDLPKFLKELQKIPLPQSRPKTELWPDWRRTSLSPFHVFFLLAFSLVLCLEWFFRRFWGLV